MARPSKSVRVKTGAIASDVEAVRQDVEDKLRGENVPPEPPADLTDGQREIFQFIVSGLVASDILGQLDVFVLESTAVAIDRLRYIIFCENNSCLFFGFCHLGRGIKHFCIPD